MPDDPRSYASRRDQYGRDPDLAWQPSAGQDAGEVAAAWMQHLLAIRVRRELADRGMSTSQMAHVLKLSADNVNRKLNGTDRLLMSDLARWALVLGPAVLPWWSDAADYRPLPPEYEAWTGNWLAGSGCVPVLASPGVRHLEAQRWQRALTVVASHVAEAVSNAAVHLIDGPVVRHWLATGIVAGGLRPEAVSIGEDLPGAGVTDLAIGPVSLQAVWVNSVLSQTPAGLASRRRVQLDFLGILERMCRCSLDSVVVLVLNAGGRAALESAWPTLSDRAPIIGWDDTRALGETQVAGLVAADLDVELSEVASITQSEYSFRVLRLVKPTSQERAGVDAPMSN